MSSRTAVIPALDVSVEINATPRLIVEAFFDAGTLGQWWGSSRSVTTTRMLGVYAVEWTGSGVIHGTVVTFEATRGFFVANLFWLPFDAEPIGPMALDVSCALCLTTEGQPATRLRVRQTGFDENARWRQYYERLQHEWPHALESLKKAVEE